MKKDLKERIKQIRKKGFTLIELIVVIAVLGILVLMAAPKFLGYTSQAMEVKLKGDLKEVSNQFEVEMTKGTVSYEDFAEINFSDVEQYKQDGDLMSIKGIVGEDYNLDAKYYKLDVSKLDVKLQAKADGEYIVSEDGDVLYYENGIGEKFEENKVSGSGDGTGNSGSGDGTGNIGSGDGTGNGGSGDGTGNGGSGDGTGNGGEGESIVNGTFTMTSQSGYSNRFGQFILTPEEGLTGDIYIKRINEGDNINDFLNVKEIPADAFLYDGVSFRAYPENVSVVYYMRDANGNIVESVFDIPADLATVSLIFPASGSRYTIRSRYDESKTVQENIQYMYVFDKNNLSIKKTDFSQNIYETSGKNRVIYIEVGSNHGLDSKEEITVMKNFVSFASSYSNAKPYVIPALKTLANEATEISKVGPFKDLLKGVADYETYAVDGSFTFNKKIDDEKAYRVAQEIKNNPSSMSAPENVYNFLLSLY